MFRKNDMIQQNNAQSAPHDKTVHDRLLDAAEQLFSEQGFDATSIRDLAAATDCNIASVNYYFGGKENLYTEVWRRQLTVLRESRLVSIRKAISCTDGPPRLEELLASYAHAFVEPLADKARSQRLIRLMAREIIDPHLPRGMFLTEMAKPTMTALEEALLKTCPHLDKSKIPVLIISLIGQLMHIMHVKTMFDQAQTADWPKLDLRQAINDIVTFSAAGIRAFEEQNPQ